VWTDTTQRDGTMVANLAHHFDYGVVDLTTILLDPAQTPVPVMTPPDVYAYLDQDRQRICHAVRAAETR
jgi:hypothetical protein